MMNMTPSIILQALAFYHILTASFAFNLSRKAFLETSSAVATMSLVSSPANAVISAPGRCASGVGDGCDELAGENEYIKQLQAKSAAKKEQYLKEAQDAYYMKNYPDFFASLSPPQYIVKKPDGTFMIVTDSELSELKNANKIKVEIPRTMNGKVLDITQKPIMVLVEDEIMKSEERLE